jgi:Na+/H+ antiporter NhaD/arsenite permease-like protein
MDPKLISIIIFVSAYLIFIVFPKHKMPAALIAAAILVLTRTLSPIDAFWAVNWNVLGIFIGTFFVASTFMESFVPAYIAEVIVQRSSNTAWAILLICAMAGAISAFVDNVSTVLIVAPIALSLAKKLKISPVAMMIGIAVSSNLQGTATLVGDPPSMMLGGYAGMNFFDFFFYHGRPSIFFAVELGAIASLFILYFFFMHMKQKVAIKPCEKITSMVPTYILLALIMTLATASIFPFGKQFSGLICITYGIVAVLWKGLKYKSPIVRMVASFDLETSLFLSCVFILVGSLTKTGWVDIASGFISHQIGSNIFIGYTTIVFISVLLSAFIDNIPYLATMLPLVSSIALNLNINPSLFLFGLLVGSCLGGNITPIGASANIVAWSILKREGHHMRFMDFVKIGLPFTIAAVIPAYLFIWVVWK